MKTSDLQCRAYELLIEDGVVISKRALDRGAGDIAQIQLGRAEEALWSILRDQSQEAIDGIKDN